MSESERARHVPLACGALGRFDRERLRQMAALLDPGMRTAHEDDQSILMLDREPVAWQGRRQRGLGWIEGATWRGGADDWRVAAERGACGMVVAGRRRFVHSSVSGLAPVYWTEHEGAVYFASRLFPLAQTSPVLLSPDWDAWASMIALRFPLGGRTPFAEIRRLGPFERLRQRLGHARVERPSWPWAELEPHLGVEAGADATAAALREALAPLTGSVLCPLSGGFDSRLLLSALATSGRVRPTAVTVSDDEGAAYEEGLAAAVTQSLGVDHERLGASIEDYWTDWEERARLVEHQFVDHAWLVTLARRVAEGAGPVPDGYALDAFMQTGQRFHVPAVLQARDPRAANDALFDSLRRYGHAHLGLDQGFHAPVVERVREQFLAAAKPFAGHPSQPQLTLYATRTVRGVSTYPNGLIGSRAPVVAPGADHATVTAMLAVPTAEKAERRMIIAVQRRLAPHLVGMPSTNDTPRPERTMPRRWCSDVALAGHRRMLADGPLAEHAAPLQAWLEDPGRGEISPDLRLAMESISLFHHWWRLYRSVLRNVDADALRGR